MKVYGMSFGRERGIVAAKTKRAAAEAFGVTLHAFNGFACPTGNPEEIEIAMGKPGTPFFRPYPNYGGVYAERA
jgi:hypothetical protein